jgi:dihydroorotase
MKTVYSNFRLVDMTNDVEGALVIENGFIKKIITEPDSRELLFELADAACYIDGAKLMGQRETVSLHEPLALLPAFIDLHAHFRDPGFPQKETLESAALAAVKGGYTTLVCMANTNPVTDTIAAAAALKTRSDALGLIDLYPAMSLTKGMEGKELTEITRLMRSLEGGNCGNFVADTPHSGIGQNVRLPPSPLRRHSPCNAPVRILSEDGKDLDDNDLFTNALRAAAGAGIPVSCHCDRDGENAATERALRLARETSAHIHLAHVSTKEAAAMVAAAKRERPGKVTAEATPHHFFLNKERADELGPETFGKVAPPLRSEADREAVLEALLDGTIDAIATDHAPHTEADKKAGAPGFSGLETAFAAACTAIVESGESDLCHLSRLMSAVPARILGLEDRGALEAGKRADLVIVNPETRWVVDNATFRSRGKNSPFDGMQLTGIILLTIFGGKIVYEV